MKKNWSNHIRFTFPYSPYDYIWFASLFCTSVHSFFLSTSLFAISISLFISSPLHFLFSISFFFFFPFLISGTFYSLFFFIHSLSLYLLLRPSVCLHFSYTCVLYLLFIISGRRSGTMISRVLRIFVCGALVGAVMHQFALCPALPCPALLSSICHRHFLNLISILSTLLFLLLLFVRVFHPFANYPGCSVSNGRRPINCVPSTAPI